jgi:putative phosphoesterase
MSDVPHIIYRFHLPGITRAEGRFLKRMVGIISDTHDDMAQIKKMVDFLNSRGVSHVIHAGDLVSPFTFEVLGALKCPFTGIFGNNDGDKVLLKEKSKDTLNNQPHILTIESKKIAVVHEPTSVEALAASGHFDVVIYGHTHTPDVRKSGDTLVINPGKVATLHKGKSTLVLLDTSTMEAEVVEL